MTARFGHCADYFPPIACLELTLRAPDGNSLPSPVLAIIDTGADITLVPQSLLGQISDPELDEVRLRSHWGEAITVITYLVDIQLGSDTLPGVEVVEDMYGERVLLGRNVSSTSCCS